MALLQIHDPSARPRPIGIDLGTTNSLVAWVTPVGEPVTIRDCDGEAIVPSAVSYIGDDIIVGKRALGLAAAHPEDTITSVKRFMGRAADDPETRRARMYRYAAESGPVVRLEVGNRRVVTPVEVSAEILRELRNRAIEELGSVGGAVITVPAYFDDAQRQATRDAGRIAGLDVLRLLNEPTAAALAYGLDSKRNGTFVVYDLGGGTFDVTVLVLDDGVFQVRSTGGDTHLGGDDMDRAIAERILGARYASADPRTLRTALDAARAMKHALTERAEVIADIELPSGVVEARLGRAELDALIAPLVARTIEAARRAVRDAELELSDIDGVVLVGGATRTPLVRAEVSRLFGKEPLGSIDPDEVVALGAAIQADLLAGAPDGPRDDVLLLDVLPLSLGIETMGGVVERILPRNTPIPAAAAQIFTTYAENQTGFELHVVQGERELASDVRSLARFTLRGIPPMAAGLARLEVRFDVDENGLLQVSAREQRTGIEQHIEVAPSYGLSEEEIERMLTEAYEHGEDDLMTRRLREERVEAERVVAATRRAMGEDAALLLPGEGAALDRAIEAAESAARGANADAIHAAVARLDDTSKAFAGRRMDTHFRAALAGRGVAGLEDETRGARGLDGHVRDGDGSEAILEGSERT